MRNSIYSITLEEALTAIGGHHRYQKRIALSCCTLFLALGTTLGALGFLREQRASPVLEWVTSPESLQLLSALFFFGAVLGAILMSLLLDFLGRRKTLFFSCYAALFSSATVGASVGLPYVYCALPLCGAACAGVAISAYLSLIEVTDEEFRVRTPAMLLASGLFGYALSVFLTLSDPKWRLLWTLAALCWALCLLLIQAVLESPRYLAVVRGKYGQARTVLQRISDINCTAKFNETLEGEKVIGYHDPGLSHEIPESISCSPDSSGKLGFVPITTGITSVSQAESTHVKRYFYWHLLSLQSIRYNFLCCLMLWCCLNVSMVSLFMVEEKALSLGGIVGAFASLLLAMKLANRIGRLHTILVCFAVVSFLSILTTIFSGFSCKSAISCRVNKTLAEVTFCGAYAMSQAAEYSLLLFMSELFPSAINSLLLGTFTATSAVVFTSLPWILSTILFINPVLLSGLVMLCLSPLLCLMKETLGEERSDYVQEEKEEMKKPADLSQVEIRNLPALVGPAGNSFPFEPINEEK